MHPTYSCTLPAADAAAGLRLLLPHHVHNLDGTPLAYPPQLCGMPTPAEPLRLLSAA
jgi:hypothetical protein